MVYTGGGERGPFQGERMAGGREEHEQSPPQLEGDGSFWELGLRGEMGPNDEAPGGHIRALHWIQ